VCSSCDSQHLALVLGVSLRGPASPLSLILSGLTQGPSFWQKSYSFDVRSLAFFPDPAMVTETKLRQATKLGKAHVKELMEKSRR
jgi:hypothetical protein